MINKKTAIFILENIIRMLPLSVMSYYLGFESVALGLLVYLTVRLDNHYQEQRSLLAYLVLKQKEQSQ